MKDDPIDVEKKESFLLIMSKMIIKKIQTEKKPGDSFLRNVLLFFFSFVDDDTNGDYDGGGGGGILIQNDFIFLT